MRFVKRIFAKFRQGSNELDRSSATARSSPVMLSAAKHLAADRDRPCAEFTLSGANVLRVTGCDSSYPALAGVRGYEITASHPTR
jgi:hypothetical protein